MVLWLAFVPLAAVLSFEFKKETSRQRAFVTLYILGGPLTLAIHLAFVPFIVGRWIMRGKAQ